MYGRTGNPNDDWDAYDEAIEMMVDQLRQEATVFIQHYDELYAQQPDDADNILMELIKKCLRKEVPVTTSDSDNPNYDDLPF